MQVRIDRGAGIEIGAVINERVLVGGCVITVSLVIQNIEAVRVGARGSSKKQRRRMLPVKVVTVQTIHQGHKVDADDATQECGGGIAVAADAQTTVVVPKRKIVDLDGAVLKAIRANREPHRLHPEVAEGV